MVSDEPVVVALLSIPLNFSIALSRKDEKKKLQRIHKIIITHES